MKADILVRSANGADVLQPCLDSIRENTPREDYRLILVLDGPAALTAEVDILISNRETQGAVTATNQGLALAVQRDDPPYVVVLDDDTRIPDGDRTWLDRWIAEMECTEPLGGAMGATSAAATGAQHILTVPSGYAEDWAAPDGRICRKRNPLIPWFCMFGVLLRKAAIASTGFLDPGYDPGGFEDMDYSVQLRANGWGIYTSQSVYLHHLGKRTKEESFFNPVGVNQKRWISKWGRGRLFDMGMIDPAQFRAALNTEGR